MAPEEPGEEVVDGGVPHCVVTQLVASEPINLVAGEPEVPVAARGPRMLLR